MFAQFYELNFNGVGYINLTNVYENLYIKNNSSMEINVFYRSILICKLEGFQEITLFKIFKTGTQYDENIQLKFENNSGLSANVKLINFGKEFKK